MAKSKFLKRPVRPVEIIQGAEVSELLSRMGETAFQGKNLAIAVDVWEQMLRGDVTIFFGLAGAMVPAGMRRVVVHLLKSKLIDCLVSTGANLFHDIHETLGKYHWQGHATANDEELKDEGIDRIYDVFAVEDEFQSADAYCYRFSKTLEKKPYTTREFLYLLGKQLSKGAKEDGILTAAYKTNIPVYCPAIGDSSIGIGLAMNPKEDNFLFDVIGDVKETALIAARAKNTGVVYAGGGTPKNFIQQTEVTAGIMGENVSGHKYAVQITADAPHWGGLSGCTFEEAQSWGKIAKKAKMVTVHCDTTIALPIMVTALAKRMKGFKRKGANLKFPLYASKTKRGGKYTQRHK
ncbi:MAG: deoxyhypusine synthase [Deltaproteobacteria bacterium RIFCSPLOWO2_12_FULL_43_16]|nr:MAG: deoxyhypusine synthase [Deltaproteobacteria bacterium GWA2_43_19]OGQ11629.1 MAG: deoxyhypusine synthase [Deltaproteobacteria bacterium RIFCSPHIGHO2_02_FULL_43_33]OGQ33517.1 MAG: deoxyhypusine synthase [Deltaproteobacteria bacterium RIFCSPLOWO2_01_FULL_42_9]OGQ60676.1 MAG: deoxyhypusine synthase [Deltaproteobacteria bacterium RIFCSPLOWO2_12_FULL_43_16]